MNNQRKVKLQRRASAYATGGVHRGDKTNGEYGALAEGFESGYRAAMRDMRKIVAECVKESAPVANAIDRVRHRNHCVRVRVQQFLRPLR